MVEHNISSSEADQWAEECECDSKPLSRSDLARARRDVDWWLSNPRNREGNSDRKSEAVYLYLEIARHVCVGDDFPSHSFAAVFDLSDGKARRPDKGIIKSWLTHDLIEAGNFRNEIIFTLTASGREQFGVN